MILKSIIFTFNTIATILYEINVFNFIVKFLFLLRYIIRFKVLKLKFFKKYSNEILNLGQYNKFI